MTPNQAALLDALVPRLSPKSIVTDAAAIAPWLTDWRRRFHGEAPALLAPETTDEVAAIVAAAAAHRVPLVPQGGNSSMVGGATPPADGSALILSLRRMNRIREMDAGAGLAIAEAGVILSDFNDAARAVGQRFPLTLGARGTATIGGLVSTNAGGTQVLRFGTMRALVAGLEAVLADGSVHDGLAALKKDNRGYDLTQLLVGAEGTLGIVTAATLRLVPDIAQRAVAWVGLASPHAALALLRRLEARDHGVESFELLPAETLAAACAHLGVASPLAGRHAWHVLIEATAGAGEGDPGPPIETALGEALAAACAHLGVASPIAGTHAWHVLIEATAQEGQGNPAPLIETLLGDALDAGEIADATIAASEAQALAFWRLRDALSDAERALGPAVQHDISVPVEAMPGFMLDAAAACEARFPGCRASGFGHLGDGNVHFHVRAPAGAAEDRWYAQEAPGITRFVHDLVVAAGGSISAEHGIGQMKRDELARLSSPARMAALRGVKAGLDTLGILNPGKLV